MKKLKLAALALLLLLFAVLAVRTLRFTSHQPVAGNFSPATLNEKRAVQRLSEMIRFPTISAQEEIAGTSSAKAFDDLRSYIEAEFPLVHSSLSREIVGGRTLLYYWKGKNPQLKPILVMAHQDVVPVDPETASLWKQDPFSGAISDGYIWGRGSLDDKASMMGILESVEYLLGSGFQPQRDVYIVFGHNEEMGGSGARSAAALLNSRKVRLESVLDEGMVIVSGMTPGITRPVALIGISEKGYLSVRLTMTQEGGHSSMPPRRTAIGILSKAIVELEKRPVPARLDGAVVRMFEHLGPEMSWGSRIIVANIWLFGPLLRFQLSRSPATNAIIRTTTAPTMISGSPKENVLPKSAVAIINFRILPGDTTRSVMDHVRNTIRNDQVKIEALTAVEPSPVSTTESGAYHNLQQTIRDVYPDTVIAPGLFIGATDSRYFADLSDSVYRFLPVPFDSESLTRFHGVNERIKITDYSRILQFYTQYIRNAAR